MSSSSSSGSSGGGPVVPSWVWNPRQKILGIVVSWIAAGVLYLNDQAVGAIDTVFTIYTRAFGDAGDSLLDAGRSVGSTFLGVISSINTALVDLAGGAGWAGPIAATITFALVMIATAWAIKRILWLLKWIT